MNCPRCTKPALFEKERDGVTVDQCPECRGIWLDRGELERLLARVQSEFEAVSPSRPPPGPPVDARRPYRSDDDSDDGLGYRAGSDSGVHHRRDGYAPPPGYPPRKRGFLHTLGELFD